MPQRHSRDKSSIRQKVLEKHAARLTVLLLGKSSTSFPVGGQEKNCRERRRLARRYLARRWRSHRWLVGFRSPQPKGRVESRVCCPLSLPPSPLPPSLSLSLFSFFAFQCQLRGGKDVEDQPCAVVCCIAQVQLFFLVKKSAWVSVEYLRMPRAAYFAQLECKLCVPIALRLASAPTLSLLPAIYLTGCYNLPCECAQLPSGTAVILNS